MSALASASTVGRFLIRTRRNSGRTADFRQQRMRKSAAKSSGRLDEETFTPLNRRRRQERRQYPALADLSKSLFRAGSTANMAAAAWAGTPLPRLTSEKADGNLKARKKSYRQENFLNSLKLFLPR